MASPRSCSSLEENGTNHSSGIWIQSAASPVWAGYKTLQHTQIVFATKTDLLGRSGPWCVDGGAAVSVVPYVVWFWSSWRGGQSRAVQTQELPSFLTGENSKSWDHWGQLMGITWTIGVPVSHWEWQDLSPSSAQDPHTINSPGFHCVLVPSEDGGIWFIIRSGLFIRDFREKPHKTSKDGLAYMRSVCGKGKDKREVCKRILASWHWCKDISPGGTLKIAKHTGNIRIEIWYKTEGKKVRIY